MKPSLETIAGLYRAAHEMQQNADRVKAQIVDSAIRHGFTERQVAEAAGVVLPEVQFTPTS
jgi:hypothetical protein